MGWITETVALQKKMPIESLPKVEVTVQRVVNWYVVLIVYVIL